MNGYEIVAAIFYIFATALIGSILMLFVEIYKLIQAEKRRGGA